jgi:hypothetical protein
MKTLLAIFFLLLLAPRDAHAYLDPGSGSLIFQALAAMLAGILIAVRSYRDRIKKFLGSWSAGLEEDERAADGRSGDAADC